MNVVGIIPARAGSRGVPGKNKKLLYGKPLIQWTIEAALKSKILSQVIVTSDDEEILDLARELGAKILERPAVLAMDDCQLDDVLLYTVRQAEANGYLNVDMSAIAVLAANHPFRNADDIDTAVMMYKNYYGNFGMSATIISMYADFRFHWRAQYEDRMLEHNNLNPGVVPIFHDPLKRLGRQWMQNELFVEAGSIYVVDGKQLLLRRSMRLEPFFAYVMPQERCVEIDIPFDWEMAEILAPRLLGGEK